MKVIGGNFQACTGIDDLGIAIMHLEEANWVLVVRIRKSYFGQVYFTMTSSGRSEQGHASAGAPGGGGC